MSGEFSEVTQYGPLQGQESFHKQPDSADDDDVHRLGTSIVSISASVHSYLSQPAFYTCAYTQAGTAITIE